MKRRTMFMLGAAMLVAPTLLGACGDGSGLTNPPPDGSNPIDDDPPNERDPEILVSIDESAGAFGEAPETSNIPDFELHRDGLVITQNFETAGAESSEYNVDQARLSDAGIDRVRDLLADVSYDDGDYGEPTITDMGTTSVYVNFGEPLGVSVYALGEDSGLSNDQFATHEHLSSVVGQLRDLPDDEDLTLEPREEYIPTAVDVAFQSAVPEEDGELVVETEWPLDEPLTERTLGVSNHGMSLCTTIDGADATTILDLLEDDADDYPWSTGAEPGSGHPTAVIVTVTAVLPGDDGCSANQPDPAQSTTIHVDPLQSVELADPSSWEGQLPADRFSAASMLDLYAAVPILVRDFNERQEIDPGAEVQAPTGSDLSWYGYQAVVAEVDGARYVDLEARYEGYERDQWQPETWRVRIDLAGETVTDLDLDG